MRNLFLILLIGFTGISPVGCGLFEEKKEGAETDDLATGDAETPQQATECHLTAETATDIKCTKSGATDLTSRFVVYADVVGKICVKSFFFAAKPTTIAKECSTISECTAKKDQWLRDRKADGFTCTTIL